MKFTKTGPNPEDWTGTSRFVKVQTTNGAFLYVNVAYIAFFQDEPGKPCCTIFMADRTIYQIACSAEDFLAELEA